MATPNRLAYPAPARCWSGTMFEGFSSHPWTVEDVVSARGGGAWFAKSRHDFADRAAALAAGVSNDD